MLGVGPVPDAGNQADENLGGGTGQGVIDNLARQVTRWGGESRLALRAFAPPRRGHFFIRKKPPVRSTTCQRRIRGDVGHHYSEYEKALAARARRPSCDKLRSEPIALPGIQGGDHARSRTPGLAIIASSRNGMASAELSRFRPKLPRASAESESSATGGRPVRPSSLEEAAVGSGLGGARDERC